MKSPLALPTHETFARWARPFAAALLFTALAACTDDAAPLGDGGATDQDAATDSGPRDALALDAAELRDAEVHPDATELRDAVVLDLGFADAASPDAEEIDSGIVDSGVRPDSGMITCDAIGQACTTSCPSPYFCQSGACTPEGRATCGGFVGAQCPPAYPDCLFYAGADYGPCFTPTELTCVCGQPNARATFPMCP